MVLGLQQSSDGEFAGLHVEMCHDVRPTRSPEQSKLWGHYEAKVASQGNPET